METGFDALLAIAELRTGEARVPNGTAFAISDAIALTARHCVYDGETPFTALHFVLPDGQALRASLIDSDEVADVALLALLDRLPPAWQPLALVDVAHCQPRLPFLVSGYPAQRSHRDPVQMDGHIVEPDATAFGGAPVVSLFSPQVAAAVPRDPHGFSGAPVRVPLGRGHNFELAVGLIRWGEVDADTGHVRAGSLLASPLAQFAERWPDVAAALTTPWQSVPEPAREQPRPPAGPAHGNARQDAPLAVDIAQRRDTATSARAGHPAPQDVRRVMHLLNRTRQAKQLETSFENALGGGDMIAPHIVLAAGNARASLHALVSRFAWYIAPIVQQRLPLKNYAAGQELPSLQRCGVQPLAGVPLKAALEDLNERVLFELLGNRPRPRAPLVKALADTISQSVPVVVFASFDQIALTAENTTALSEWVHFWGAIGDHEIRRPISIFIYFQSSGLVPFSTWNHFSYDRRCTRWLRRSRPTDRNVETCILDVLAPMSARDILLWAEVFAGGLAPNAQERVPELAAAIRRIFRSPVKRWHMEDVFQKLPPILTEKLGIY